MGDWTSRTWMGAMGSGVSGSVLIGGSAYQIDLFRVDGQGLPMRVLITGFRAGIMAEVGAGHVLCMVQNVEKPSDFREIKGKGIDWALGAGVDADSAVKSGAKVAKELVKEAVVAAGKKAGAWVGEESAKKVIQAVGGDFDPTTKDPAFIMLPTPLAVSAGIGLFYEWQTLRKADGDRAAYQHMPPEWRITGSGADLTLEMRNIPEQEGTRLCLLFENDSWGTNETLHFSKTKGARVSNATDEVWIKVRGGRAFYDEAEGIPLGKLYITGETETAWTTLGKPKSADYADKTLNLQFGISRGRTNIFRWFSDDDVKVTTDKDGRIKSAKTSAWQD